MGFLFEIIGQFFLEFVVQVVGEVLVETLFHRLARISWVVKTLDALVALLLYFGLGLITGWLSTLVFPNSFIRSSRLHGISLLIASPGRPNDVWYRLDT